MFCFASLDGARERSRSHPNARTRRDSSPSPPSSSRARAQTERFFGFDGGKFVKKLGFKNGFQVVQHLLGCLLSNLANDRLVSNSLESCFGKFVINFY